MGGSQGLERVARIRRGTAQRDIRRERVREQRRLLGHPREGARGGAGGSANERDAVEEHVARAGRIEPEERAKERRLADSRGPHDGDDGARLDAQRHRSQSPALQAQTSQLEHGERPAAARHGPRDIGNGIGIARRRHLRVDDLHQVFARAAGPIESEPSIRHLAQRPVHQKEGYREAEQSRAVGDASEPSPPRRSHGDNQRRRAEHFVGAAQRRGARFQSCRAARERLAQDLDARSGLLLRPVGDPQVRVPHRLVGRLEKPSALVPGCAAGPLVARAPPPERDAEDAEDDRGNRGHSRRQPDQHRRQRNELRESPQATEKALLEPDFHLVHAFGERGHYERRRRAAGPFLPMIAVSRAAQPVNGKERIQQTQAQPAAYLTRYSSLNVRGVNAGRSLDEDSRKTNCRKEKRLVRCRPPEAQGTGSDPPESPGLRQKYRHPPRDERHGGVAGRVHCCRKSKGHEVFSPRVTRPSWRT